MEETTSKHTKKEEMHFELVLSNMLMFNASTILEISYMLTLIHVIQRQGYIYIPNNHFITEPVYNLTHTIRCGIL